MRPSQGSEGVAKGSARGSGGAGMAGRVCAQRRSRNGGARGPRRRGPGRRHQSWCSMAVRFGCGSSRALVKDGFDAAPASGGVEAWLASCLGGRRLGCSEFEGAHAAAPVGRSSLWSQERENLRSRSAVASEICRTSAASSMVRARKKRSSTSWALRWSRSFELVEGAGQVEDLLGGGGFRAFDPGELFGEGKLDGERAAAALGEVAAGVVLEDVAHHAGGKRVEVGAVVPGDFALVEEAEVDLVDERGGLEGVVVALAAHVAAGDSVELLVDEWHEFCEDRLGRPRASAGAFRSVRRTARAARAFRSSRWGSPWCEFPCLWRVRCRA